MLNHYHYIITGAGAAGLSLLMRLMQHEELSGKDILVLDKHKKTTNDRTWCFWQKEAGLFQDIVYHSWQQAHFFSNSYSRLLELSPYTYKMIRGIDLYSEVLQKAERFNNIHFSYGEVNSVHTNSNHASVNLNGNVITADYVFNSILFSKPVGSYNLLQHFKGVVIETPRSVFNASLATLMDFRVSQQHGTTFVYVLPFSANRALVEYTLFTPQLLQPAEYDEALQAYMQQYLGITSYEVTDTEFGIIPMTNYSFTRNNGRVINLGTAGGDTKGSSGYTFNFIQKTCDQIVAALLAGKPPYVHHSLLQRRFSFYDSTLLNILCNNKMPGADIFTTLFRNNPAPRVLQFLDNESSLLQEVKLMRTLPQLLFLKAACQQFF